MKKLIYTLLLFAFAVSLNAQWVQVSSGMGNNKIVLSLGAIGTYIVAGTTLSTNSDTSGVVYFSTNNGTNWIQSQLLYRNALAFCVGGINLYAGTAFNEGLYHSTNLGVSWFPSEITKRTGTSFASGNNLYFGTDSGVYRSGNGGTNWTHTGITKIVSSLAVLGNNVFAGTSNIGVYYSSNMGYNWSQTSFNSKIVLSFAVVGYNVFAGTDGSGVYLSSDSGKTWTQKGLTGKMVNSMVVYNNIIFAGVNTNFGIYRSTDLGTTWTAVNQGLVTGTVYSLLIANNYIFAGNISNSVWRRPLSEVIGITNISTEIPSAFSLGQNYPNPFNPTTKIRFEIPSLSFLHASGRNLVLLKVFDIMGKEVQTLVNESLAPGTYETTFDGSNLSSGVYFYKLTSGDFTETKKLTLLK